MTTGGEGGMVTTNSKKWWSTMWSFKDHGKSWEAMYERAHAPGYRWVHEAFGTNWRMLETQAVLGRVQLRKMPLWTAQRRANAEKITAVCQHSAVVRVPVIPADVEHAFYKFYVFVEPDKLAEGWTRDRIVHEIAERGVPCTQGSCSELYLEKAFDHTGYRPKLRLPVAQELGETSLMFLVHPSLTDEDVERTCDVVADVLSHASD
jgi:dTDP-4-amino-4,6-dideoxygalactose transaminase